METMDGLARERGAGERLTVHAFRRDELFTTDVELAEAPRDTCYLTLRADTPAQAERLRHAWLHG